MENKRARVDNPPKKNGINDRLPVELLKMLFRFVLQEFTHEFATALAPKWVRENAVVVHDDVSSITIVSRAKLRYLCRLWNALAEQPLSLDMSIRGGEKFGYVTILDRSAVKLSNGQLFQDLPGLASSSDLSIKPLSECVDSLVVWFNYWDTRLHKKKCVSLASMLYRVTPTLPQACRLFLDLDATDTRHFDHFIKDFDIPFECIFPSLSLEKLRLNWPFLPQDEPPSERRCLIYLLQFGHKTLVELSLDIDVLSRAFASDDQERSDDGGVAGLPADWICESLRTLNLEIGTRSPAAIDGRPAAFAAHRVLRHHFPNTTTLSIQAGRPHIDFAALNDFACLRTFELSSYVTTVALRAEANLVPLPNIESFQLQTTAQFPLHLSFFLPNMKELTLAPRRYPAAFSDLCNELDTVPNSFERLEKLDLKQWCYILPPFTDLVRLLRSLCRLSSLVCLNIHCHIEFDDWSPAGNLSLVQVLPKSVTHASFTFSLRPSGVVHNPEPLGDWVLSVEPYVPNAEETVYKDWLRALLCRIHEHAGLQHFYCACVAPSFEAIYALAERWNGSSVGAISELGLAFVRHIQCEPVYTRMIGARTPRHGDRFKFRFVLASPLKLAASMEESSSKRTIVTVEFENPN